MKSPVRVRAKGAGAARGAVCLLRKAADGAPVDGGSRRTTSGFRHRPFLTSPASVRPRGISRSAWHHGFPRMMRIVSGQSAGEAESPQSSYLRALLASRFQSGTSDRGAVATQSQRRGQELREDRGHFKEKSTHVLSEQNATQGAANNAFSSQLAQATQVSHARAASGLDLAACEISRWWRRRGMRARVRASTLADRSCRINQD